ncbi:unnamed protein product [Dicrocoelium dendriticum]|nr:unnamed protein product [Dicrocoelium dendriticum]
MCRHCCNLLAGDHCVSECTDIPGFYEVPDLAAGKLRLSTPSGSTPQPFCRTLPLNQSQIDILNDAVVRETKLPPKRCGVCHEECAETCYGPGANECKGACKHFQDGDYCVRECPREKYAEQGTNRCLPCNATCTQAFVAPETRLCSGPGDYLGLGGCTACWTVLQSKETNRFHCLINDCPASHYTESHKTLDFVEANRISISQEAKQVALATTEAGGMIRVCKPCHPFCDVCTANGTHMSICHSCLHWWFRVECVKECPPAETYTIKANETEDITNETAMGQPSIEELNQRDRRSSEEKTKSGPIRDTHAESLLLLPGAIDQKHCLLCHEECIQGCSGPGPEHCVRCRNYKIIIDGEKNTFVCNSSCPDDKPHMFHGMCLDSQQFSKLSGRSAKELRDRILIGVAVAVILLILLVTTILAMCLKRRAESERTREKLFSAYTNLHEAERVS